jgi:putative ABC transport system permease protein
VLSLLIVAAIAVGIGVAMTSLTIYHMLSRDPIPEKSDQLFRVQLDSWDPDSPFFEGGDGEPSGPPFWLTYQDAMALLESDIPKAHTANYRSGAVLETGDPDVAPAVYGVRATTRGFFSMFNVPFRFGSAWGETADRDGLPVVVIGEETNQKLFGGEDSTGRTVRLGDDEFRIVGVLETWNPHPRFYDLNMSTFGDPEEIFVPMRAATDREWDINGNTSCWKPERLVSFADFKGSECVWVMFWAELSDRESRDAYMNWLDGYVAQQKAAGRFPRPMDNRLRDVGEWLAHRQVVSDDSRVVVALAFLFLVVCLLNAVGLLLAKFAGTAPSAAIRRALGASRWDIVRQYLTEVGAIGVAGGLVGLLLAAAGLWSLRQGFEDLANVARLDLAMGLTAIGLAFLAALAAGLYPAWRVGRAVPVRFLKSQ